MTPGAGPTDDGAARAARPRRPGVVARVLLSVLQVYRAGISPLLGPRCRFAPSCSAYAVEAVTVHGAARGSLLAARRLARCHPLHAGGHDPVPPATPRAGPPDPDLP